MLIILIDSLNINTIVEDFNIRNIDFYLSNDEMYIHNKKDYQYIIEYFIKNNIKRDGRSAGW